MSNEEIYNSALNEADRLLDFASPNGESVIAQDVADYVKTGVETPGYREGQGAMQLAALYIALANAAKPVAPIAADQADDWSP